MEWQFYVQNHLLLCRGGRNSRNVGTTLRATVKNDGSSPK